MMFVFSKTKVCWLRTPADRFGAAVVVDNKFIPHQIDPSSGDGRVLGAEVTYTFVKKAPPRALRNTCR